MRYNNSQNFSSYSINAEKEEYLTYKEATSKSILK